MKHFLGTCLVLIFSVPIWAWEFSGEIGQESRAFFRPGLYNNTNQLDLSLTAKSELSHSWDDDRKVITFIPYIRLSEPDVERSHIDIREASYVGSWDMLELRVGISKVYWGVTESQHLVDVINQTDFVENPDGEDKLGQPMINPTLVTDYGNIAYFYLPFFRERPFPGRLGRFRGPILIDTDNATYESADRSNHADHAIRYTHQFHDLEYGISYFNGTDREPIFIANGTTLTPHYVQARQVGIDAQYILGALALKFEGIRKERTTRNPYTATTSGFEYTFANVHKGMDIGVLTEYLTDDRGRNSEAVFNNHLFSGARISYNDEAGTEFLGGALFNLDNSRFQSIRIESSARFNNQWKWEFELNTIFNTDSGQIFDAYRNDDYVQLTMSYFY